MGVKNLWDILEPCKQTLPLHHLQNKRLCVDLSCWLIQLQQASKWHAGGEKIYLRSFFHRIRALIALNCSLIFVTDGSIPEIKMSTYRRRLGLGSEDTFDYTNSRWGPSRQRKMGQRKMGHRNMGSEFSRMTGEAKSLGLALGIPFLDGREEAEAQCALLNMANLCDGCFSSDSDIFLFGAKTVYRDIVLNESGHVTCYEMSDIKQKLGLGRNSLIALALLLGSDYSPGIRGFGTVTAYKVVMSIGDESVLEKAVSEGFALPEKNKETKKTTKNGNSDQNKENDLYYSQYINEKKQQMSNSIEQFEQVIKAYMKPKCHSRKSMAVQSACNQGTFIRAELHKLCRYYFGWDRNITDEYILPKIAERDLRRFANLRNVSSSLGARIPLDKMSVPCPVSAIIHQRKVQGQDYFEVSWHQIQGLLKSSVPADLIESACPEMIDEFIATKCEAQKKQGKKPRPREPSKSAAPEPDINLENLVIGVESDTDDVPVMKKNQDSTGVLIDLSSPSPPLRACKLSRFRKTADCSMKVIDICDSETDNTPEHDKKARQLRLFLDSIKDDLY